MSLSNPKISSTTSDAETDRMPLKPKIKNINKRCVFDLALNAVLNRSNMDSRFLLRLFFIATKTKNV